MMVVKAILEVALSDTCPLDMIHTNFNFESLETSRPNLNLSREVYMVMNINFDNFSVSL